MKPDAEQLPLSEERIAYWRREIDKARTKRKDVAAKHDWDGNLERYEPAPKEKGDINIGVDFSDVERKKAALLFDTPSVSLTDGPMELQQAISIHSELLNTLLGPEHADVQPTALKAIFNCLCPSGVGPVVVGYHCTKQPTRVMAPVVDEDGMPALDPMTLLPAVEEQEVDIPIHERFFVTSLSPKSLLIPAGFRDTAYQRAPWLGYEWEKPRSQVKREYNITEDIGGSGSEGDEIHFKRDESNDDVAGDPMVRGATIWYRAEIEGGDKVIHPELVRILVMADGIEKPLEHRDSPDQTLLVEGPEAGRLTPDSLMGFNVRPLVLRDATDAAWVSSDCAQTAALTKEQNKYRTNALQKRDTNVSVIAYEASLADAIEDAKKSAGTGATVWVPVPDGALAGGQVKAAQLTQAVVQRDTYTDQELIRQDRARVLGIDNNQVGLSTGPKKTATESSITQRNTDARFEQERQRVLKWYLYDIVRPFDALVLRYCDERMAVQILGPQKGAQWFAAKQMLAGGYRYSLQMDSGKYMDVEQDRQQMLNVINFAAKSPFVNQQFLWAKFAEKFGYDPTQFMAQPQPPKPEPPKVQLSFNGQDLASPQGPVVLAILQQLGVVIPPEAVAMMQSAQMMQANLQMQEAALGGSAKSETHGGPADKADRIDQHTASLTGKLPGNAPS
jgi:hypothetical protein